MQVMPLLDCFKCHKKKHPKLKIAIPLHNHISYSTAENIPSARSEVKDITPPHARRIEVKMQSR